MGNSLVGTRFIFSLAAKDRIVSTFKQITQLHLPDVHSQIFARMFSIVSSCPLLEVLSIELKPDRVVCLAEAPIYAHLWQLLERNSTAVPRLQQLTVRTIDRMVIEAVSCKGPLSSTVVWNASQAGYLAGASLLSPEQLHSIKRHGASTWLPCRIWGD